MISIDSRLTTHAAASIAAACAFIYLGWACGPSPAPGDPTALDGRSPGRDDPTTADGVAAHTALTAPFATLTTTSRRAAISAAPVVTLTMKLPKLAPSPPAETIGSVNADSATTGSAPPDSATTGSATTGSVNVTGTWQWRGLGRHLDGADSMTLLLAPNISQRTGSPARGDGRLMTIGAVRVNGVSIDPTGDSVLMRVATGSVGSDQGLTVAVDFHLRIPNTPRPQWGGSGDALQRADLDSLFALVAGGGDFQHLLGVREQTLHLARFCPMVVPPEIAASRPTSGEAIGRFEPYNLTLLITAPTGITVAASGTPEGVQRMADGQSLWRFKQAGTREVGVVAGAALSLSATQVGPTRLQVLSQTPHGAVVAEVQRWARRALDEFELRFGPYPHQTLTIAEAPLPGSLGGLATSGMVALSDLFFAARGHIVNAREDPLMAVITGHPALREGLEFVVAHEIAHQWWGLAVASDRVASPWVDEGLANHAALDYIRQVHGAKAYRRARELHTRLPFQISRRAGGRDLPVATALGGFRDVVEYGGIVYGKAGAYFDALSRMMGPQAMNLALGSVLSSHDLKALTPTALRDALATAAADPARVRQLSRRWLDEAHGDEDIGPIQVDVLAEYFIGDALLDQGTRELLGALMDNPQVGAIFDALMARDPSGDLRPDLAKAFTIIAESFGADDPLLKQWVGLAGRAISGDPADWGPDAVKALVGTFGDEVGLGAKEQAAIGTLADLLFKLAADPEPNPATPAAKQPFNGDKAPTP